MNTALAAAEPPEPAKPVYWPVTLTSIGVGGTATIWWDMPATNTNFDPAVLPIVTSPIALGHVMRHP